MRLKSFFADTIEQAIAKARRDMGPDAMLVHSKPTSVEGRHLGAYEVVVCTDPAEPSGADRGPAEYARDMQMPALPSMNKLSQEVSELRRQMERLEIALARSGSGMAGAASDREHARLLSRLADAELDMDLACDVMAKIGSDGAPGVARSELLRLARTDAVLGQPEARVRAVALVGPPGAGKTTSLVKLAVQYGIAVRQSTQILSVDTYRIAASDELRSFAAILGIGCQILETTAALEHALETHRDKSLILIDTPGLCRDEMDASQDLTQFLADNPDLDTHLVLPASMRAADLNRLAGQYAVFKPRKLLFTRLDETETFGPLLTQSARLAMPISFLSRGQRIPEDLEPATPDLLVDLLLGSESAQGPKFDRAAA